MVIKSQTQNKSTSMTLLDSDARLLMDDYIGQVAFDIADLPGDIVRDLLAKVRAQIELDIELERLGSDVDTVNAALKRLGDPHQYASHLRTNYQSATGTTPEQKRTVAAMEQDRENVAAMQPCRVCSKMISTLAVMCPNCGAPTKRLYRGYEWKSKTAICGYPLVHVAFGKDENGKIRVAKGVIAIGQFAIGAFTIAQFGIGFIAGLVNSCWRQYLWVSSLLVLLLSVSLH